MSGQPLNARRTQAQRIQGLIESAEATNDGTRTTLTIYQYAAGHGTIRPRKGFRDRGGHGVDAGVPVHDRDQLLAVLTQVLDETRP